MLKKKFVFIEENVHFEEKKLKFPKLRHLFKKKTVHKMDFWYSVETLLIKHKMKTGKKTNKKNFVLNENKIKKTILFIFINFIY